MKTGSLAVPIAVLGMATFGTIPAKAQTPSPGVNKGFMTPGTSFGNPFAGRQGTKSPDSFEEDDFTDFDDTEVEDISDEILRQRMEQRLKERGTQAASGAKSGQPGSSPGSTFSRPGGVDFDRTGQSLGNNSLQGGANSQITAGQNTSCLKLDPFTGYGPDKITNFDFPNADIVEIAKTLGRLTCLNFILEKDVKGTISVVSNSPITVGDAWKAFLTALDVNGFTVIPSGKYLRIARQRDAKDKQIKTYSGDFSPDTDMFITRVLPLKYISAEEVARVFRNFTPPNTRVLSYDQTNTLIITDTGANIKKLVDMIQLLDVEGFDEGLEVIRIKYASAQDIAKLIDQLLPGSGSRGAMPPGGAPAFRSGFQARKTKEGGMISHIIPDDRTNSVIVSANAKGLEQVKGLITKLDSKISASQGGSRIHVVYLQFADAEQVAQTLNNLATSSGGPRPPVASGQPGASVSTAQLFEGAIKISADKATNSLVITGTPADFSTVSRVIQKLDVPRDQVYVEAVIMEMGVQKSNQFGVNIAAPTSGIGTITNGADFQNFLLNPLSVSGAVLGFQAGKGGMDYTPPGASKSIRISSIQGLVKALQTTTNGNVLATPQILTLDNQEANIEISEQIPVPTTTQVPNVGLQTSVSYQKVALSLTIKPQINKISSFVKLDIQQKLEDVSNRPPPSGVAGIAVGTIGRSSKTTVVVQDSDTVAMGGLVRDKTREATSKVPLLGDIPILGWLFSSKTTEVDKTNLLVFITPKIIKQYQTARTILDSKIRQRDDFLEKNAGGKDQYQDYKMDMIKSLPPISELKSGGRVENAEIEGAEEQDLDVTPENSGGKSEIIKKHGFNKQSAQGPGAAAGQPVQNIDPALPPRVEPNNTSAPVPVTPGVEPRPTILGPEPTTPAAPPTPPATGTSAIPPRG